MGPDDWNLVTGHRSADDVIVRTEAVPLDGEPAAPPGSRPFWREHLAGLAAAAGFVVLGVWGIGYWATRPHAPDYTGQTRLVQLEYRCTNHIDWQDAKSGYSWTWNGATTRDDSHSNWIPPKHLDTSTPDPANGPADYPHHHATGSLHFDSPTQATFTSDAGAVLELTRQPLHSLSEASCAMATDSQL
jgi:hypothetical protein